MKRFILVFVILSAVSFFNLSGVLAATVDGHAYKDDQTDHSGITIAMEPLPPIPAIGVMGLLLLILGFTFFLLRKRIRMGMNPLVVCFVTGLSCLTYAAIRADTVTNSLGEYNFADIEPGGYSIDASALGYYPARIASFTIIDGANIAPELTLYPIATPTPMSTSTPTDTPTEIPTNTPTDTPMPTDTPTPTSTPTDTPTETPTETPTMPPTDTPTSTPTNTHTATPTPVFVSVGNLVSISAGTFTQGSPGTEPCRLLESQFTHTLTRNLAVMETEITRQMWADLRAVQGTLPVDPSNTTYSPTMGHPVQNATWQESVLFANLLSMQNGYMPCYYTDSSFTTPIDASNYTTGPFYFDYNADGYRLPTEGEWEYFCRAGTTTAFSCYETNYTSDNCSSCISGTHPVLEQYCVYCANDPGTTELVGSKLSNPWNLKDVHGNVWEWCWDLYGGYPSGSATDYTGWTSGVNRVIQGGSWDIYARICRSALRAANTPSIRYSSNGFRLLRSI